MSDKCILIFGNNDLENVSLLLRAWMVKKKPVVMSDDMPARTRTIASKILFLRKYIQAIEKKDAVIGKYFFDLQKEAVDLTLEFFDRFITKDNKIIQYYNGSLNTNKVEAYFKKEISIQIASILRVLYLVEAADCGSDQIIISKNRINRFVLEKFFEKRQPFSNVRKVICLSGPFLFISYYISLLADIFRRGIVIRQEKEEFLVSKHVSWGFSAPTLRDDIMVDNRNIKKNDFLIFSFESKNKKYQEILNEARDKGYRAINISDIKININKSFFEMVYFYVIVPVATIFRLIFSSKMYLLYYVFKFHRRCLFIEIFMNMYKIKVNISNTENDDIVTTIIMNKYGTKNVLFHWSDLTACEGYRHCFTAHNIYYLWAEKHFDKIRGRNFMDEKNIVGCIFKRGFNNCDRGDVINSKKYDPQRKTVVFFDTSFKNSERFSNQFFLEYMTMIEGFGSNNLDVNVILKPKTRNITLGSFGNNKDQYNDYLAVNERLSRLDNFIYYDNEKAGVEGAIAVSDVCVSMGINSPSTLAIILGKNGLYYDKTGDDYHPFARKYMDRIVFSDKECLFQQIRKILNDDIQCSDIIDKEDVRSFDAFEDDMAFERIRTNILEIANRG